MITSASPSPSPRRKWKLFQRLSSALPSETSKPQSPTEFLCPIPGSLMTPVDLSSISLRLCRNLGHPEGTQIQSLSSVPTTLKFLIYDARVGSTTSSSASTFTVNQTKVKQISWNPRAFVYEGLLTDAKCDHLISIAKSELKRSAVVGASRSHPASLSESRLLEDITGGISMTPVRQTRKLTQIPNLPRPVARLYCKIKKFPNPRSSLSLSDGSEETCRRPAGCPGGELRR
ncbi:hypothetical protein ACFX2J_046329 [Malus domestica]